MSIIDKMRPTVQSLTLTDKVTGESIDVDVVVPTFFEWFDTVDMVDTPQPPLTKLENGKKVANEDDPDYQKARQDALNQRKLLLCALALDKAGADWGDHDGELIDKANGLAEVKPAYINGIYAFLSSALMPGVKMRELETHAEGFQPDESMGNAGAAADGVDA